jgi:hypothetical protein
VVHGITYSDMTDTRQHPKGQWTSALFPLCARYFSALKTETASAFRLLHTNCHTTYCHVPKITNIINKGFYLIILICSLHVIYVTISSNIVLQYSCMTLTVTLYCSTAA